jgi:MFS family permease
MMICRSSAAAGGSVRPWRDATWVRAMGAGVGSGSMMAAAIGTIYGQSPPEMAKELIAIASAANLMTAVFGFHCWQKLVLAGILLEDVGKASCHHGSEAVILKIPRPQLRETSRS